MSFKIPAFLIKKIFPPKKSVFTVDTTGDGKADSIQIIALNVIQPFTIPENIDLGEFDLEDFDLTDYGEILLDEEPLDISKQNINIQAIRESVTVYHKGESFTIDEVLGGKAGGKTIAMGDKLTILIKLNEGDLNKLTVGKHSITVEAENIPTLEINFELTDESINLQFDPHST
jgi:hypothetical protein